MSVKIVIVLIAHPRHYVHFVFMLCVIEHLPGICLSCIWSKWNGKLSRSHSLPLDWNIIFCWRVLFLSENRLNFSICFPKFVRMNPSINRSRPITVLCIIWYLSLYVQSHTVAPQNVWIYIKHQHACAQLTPLRPRRRRRQRRIPKHVIYLFGVLSMWTLCGNATHTNKHTHYAQAYTRKPAHSYNNNENNNNKEQTKLFYILSRTRSEHTKNPHTKTQCIANFHRSGCSDVSASYTRMVDAFIYGPQSNTHTHNDSLFWFCLMAFY